MPSPSKRPQRTRKEPAHKNEVVDSSPSRPAKRRKKTDNPPEDAPTDAEDTKPLPTSRADLQLDDEELIAAVIPHLVVPAFHVQATHDHANSLHEKHHKEGVQAYAKLAGKDWTFYVKQLKNLIGRPPEGTEAKKPYSDDKEGMQVDDDDDGRVQVDLGPNKVVSREHANIYFDSDTESWNIEVLGRNAIRLNNDSIKRGAKLKLISGQVIEIGGVEMMFVLPEQDGMLAVHNKFLARAKLIADDTKYTLPSAIPPVSLAVETPTRLQSGYGIPGALPIAPAPPNYQRPGTPLSAQSRTPYSTMKSPYAGGTIFMNSENVDLAADENALIKPSFSYANLISQAILSEKDEKLNLNGIYTYIMSKYAYYRHQPPSGWQNSIRHNLSLNKAFLKVPRSTDEPGKGMKWTITPENRDEMIRGCAKGGRGGHRGSSIPNSPANFGDPRFFKNEGAPSSGPRKRSPQSGSPGFPNTAPQLTPDRKTQLSRSLDETPGDGSPLPPHRRSRNNFGLTDNLSGSPPPISSSYLPEDGMSFATPAPHRVHPRLAPPSTAQRPSQMMPTSSPAPFWKYADIGNTPMKGFGLESSPIKGLGHQIPPSSSPPPVRRSSAASPSRGSAIKAEIPQMDDIEEEDKGFDLTMGFQSISSFHASGPNGIMGKTNGVPGR